MESDQNLIFIEVRKYNQLFACAMNEYAIKCVMNYVKDSINNSKLQLKFTNSDENFECFLDVGNELKNQIMKILNGNTSITTK